MIRLVRPSAVLCTAMLLAPFPVNGQQQRYSAEVEDRIRQVETHLAGWVRLGTDDTWSLADRMKKYRINGVSIAVIHNYKVEWARGYGLADMSEKRPVTPATLFQAASISKSLNSVGIMKLVQQGKLGLDKDINNYLVTWKFPYDEKAGGKPITLNNLLSHTGGLSIHGFPGYERGDTLPSLTEILDGRRPANTDPVRSIEEPGKNVIYSGGGTTISQLIVMDVTHQPYEKFMRENVLNPLGMKSSSFLQPPPESKGGLLATGYKGDGTEIKGKYHVYPEQAAAGLWTNPSDLSLYVIETQLSWQGKSSLVLTPEMTRLRLTPVLEDAALGTFVNSRVTGSLKYFNHNGGNAGFSCTAIGCRDNGEGVVIMINSENSSILEEIANSVAQVYEWKDYYLPESKTVIDITESLATDYSGEYEINGTKIIVRPAVAGLEFSVEGEGNWPVYFTSDSDFFVREARGMMKFLSDSSNRVTGISFNGMIIKRVK